MHPEGSILIYAVAFLSFDLAAWPRFLPLISLSLAGPRGVNECSQTQFSPPQFVSRGTGKQEKFEERAKANVDTIGPDDIKGKGSTNVIEANIPYLLFSDSYTVSKYSPI